MRWPRSPVGADDWQAWMTERLGRHYFQLTIHGGIYEQQAYFRFFNPQFKNTLFPSISRFQFNRTVNQSGSYFYTSICRCAVHHQSRIWLQSENSNAEFTDCNTNNQNSRCHETQTRSLAGQRRMASWMGIVHRR